MAIALATIPSPGIGVAVDHITSQPETIILKHFPSATKWTVTSSDGSPLIDIKVPIVTISHRKAFTDVNDNTLFEMRRIGSTFYYGAESDDGPRLWELRSRGTLKGSNNTITFKNAAGEGKSEIFYKHNTFGNSRIQYEGEDVAVVDKKTFAVGTEYHISVAEGIDKSLVAGAVLAIDDKVRTIKGMSSLNNHAISSALGS